MYYLKYKIGFGPFSFSCPDTFTALCCTSSFCYPRGAMLNVTPSSK